MFSLEGVFLMIMYKSEYVQRQTVFRYRFETPMTRLSLAFTSVNKKYYSCAYIQLINIYRIHGHKSPNIIFTHFCGYSAQSMVNIKMVEIQKGR